MVKIELLYLHISSRIEVRRIVQKQLGCQVSACMTKLVSGSRKKLINNPSAGNSAEGFYKGVMKTIVSRGSLQDLGVQSILRCRR